MHKEHPLQGQGEKHLKARFVYIKILRKRERISVTMERNGKKSLLCLVWDFKWEKGKKFKFILSKYLYQSYVIHSTKQKSKGKNVQKFGSTVKEVDSLNKTM